MKSKMIALALMMAYGAAFAGRNSVTCESIDPTFYPQYLVEVELFDVTHPGYYLMTVHRTDDGFPGPITIELKKEGPGKISPSGTFSMSTEDGTKLKIRRRPNGVLKGVMDINVFGEMDRNVELVCKR